MDAKNSKMGWQKHAKCYLHPQYNKPDRNCNAILETYAWDQCGLKHQNQEKIQTLPMKESNLHIKWCLITIVIDICRRHPKVSRRLWLVSVPPSTSNTTSLKVEHRQTSQLNNTNLICMDHNYLNTCALSINPINYRGHGIDINHDI